MINDKNQPPTVVEWPTNMTTDEFLNRVEDTVAEISKSNKITYPEWLYGSPEGRLFEIKLEDFPNPGQTTQLEIDSGKTVFLSAFMQRAFFENGGFLNGMIEDTSAVQEAIQPAQDAVYGVRGTGIPVVHLRKGLDEDVTDVPFFTMLREQLLHSQIEEVSGNDLLFRNTEDWEIIDPVEPTPILDELVIDTPVGGFTKRIQEFLVEEEITYIVICGSLINEVETIIRQANKLGYVTILLKDATGAIDDNQHQSTVSRIKSHQGDLGWVAESESFVRSVDVDLKKPCC